MIVGQRIKARLEALQVQEPDFSQAELARRVGMSQSGMVNLIAGRSRSTTYLHLIARELRTTPAYLSGETEDPQADAPDDPVLTHDEVEWVAYWRMLDCDERRTMVDLIELLLRHRGQGAPMAKAA